MPRASTVQQKQKQKGGPRNFRKPATDLEHLHDGLEELASEGVKDAFATYEYCHQSSPSIRPRLKSLAQMKELLMKLVAANPHMTILYSDLKKAFTDVFDANRDIKPDRAGSSAQNAQRLASTLIVVQKHCRDITEKHVLDFTHQ